MGGARDAKGVFPSMVWQKCFCIHMTTAHLRAATESDLAAICAIYNYYVETCTCTYQIEADTLEARRAWWQGRGPRHPVLVAEVEGRVVAWGSLSPFHKREAFALTVENSVYVHHEWQGRGLGRKLLEALLLAGREAGLHTIIAAISADQPASIGLHEKLGFYETGRLREVGRKFGKVLDLVYLQHMFHP